MLDSAWSECYYVFCDMGVHSMVANETRHGSYVCLYIDIYTYICMYSYYVYIFIYLYT